MFSTSLKIVCAIAILKQVGAEVFSAVADIDPLLNTHQRVINTIETYLYTEQQRLEILNNFLDHYKKNHILMQEDPDYFGNPINAFTLISRLTTDLQMVEFYANSAHTIFHKEFAGPLPTDDDLKGASTGLLRIQNTYKLNVLDLSQGVIQGTFSHGSKPYVEKVSPITVRGLFELGRQAYLENNFRNAIDWMMETLKRLKSKPKTELVNFEEADVVDWIRMSYHWMGDFSNAMIWTEKLLALRPDSKDAKDRLVEYNNHSMQRELLADSEQGVQQPQQNQYQFQKPTSADFIQRYYDLCRGDQPLPNNITKNLYCYYKTGPEPFLMLARIKAELVFPDPAVILFHQVISDHEIQFLMQMSKKKILRRSTVVDNTGKTSGLTLPFRICKIAWFNDEDSEIVARISRRVMDFSDLSVDTAEALQVANYGIGGHYEAHHDFLNDTQYTKNSGNRVATVLFYMSDVEQGGATTFTEFGLTVFPIKNSAIFWMNLHPSGEPDIRTRHGACPVLRGSKWVCNKWIHLGGQEFKRPCTLEYQNQSV